MRKNKILLSDIYTSPGIEALPHHTIFHAKSARVGPGCPGFLPGGGVFLGARDRSGILLPGKPGKRYKRIARFFAAAKNALCMEAFPKAEVLGKPL
jgi:hypothetical protein